MERSRRGKGLKDVLVVVGALDGLTKPVLKTTRTSKPGAETPLFHP